MSDLRIEWDPRKTRPTSASTKCRSRMPLQSLVFADERALLLDDPDHSDEEDRFVLIGLSASLRTLVVCHCYREADEVIRIMSARKASKPERTEYARRWKP